MELIDSHAHIFLEEFNSDIKGVIEGYKNVGVSKVLLPNIDASTIKDVRELSDLEPSCLPMMGLHPCYVKEDYLDQLKMIENELFKGEFIAVGEIGTDLYWDKTFWIHQKEALKTQIGWAKQLNLPVVLHCRESIDETISIIEEEQDGSLKGVFHCFTGTEMQAKKIIDLGFYLGIGGVLTFKNSGLSDQIKNIPLSEMILETDSPYLAPTPYRGKRNTPEFLKLIAAKLGETLGVTTEEVANVTTRNCVELFDL